MSISILRIGIVSDFYRNEEITYNKVIKNQALPSRSEYCSIPLRFIGS